MNSNTQLIFISFYISYTTVEIQIITTFLTFSFSPVGADHGVSVVFQSKEVEVLGAGKNHFSNITTTEIPHVPTEVILFHIHVYH